MTFLDVPGFLPGTAQEHGGLIKHGAEPLFAYAEATVPKLTVITRKAFGGACDVMASKHLRGDFNYAWPSAQIAVMGEGGGRDHLPCRYRRCAEDRRAHAGNMKSRFLSLFVAVERGCIDEVIMPHSTRRRVARGLAMLRHEEVGEPWKKHDNIPLRAGLRGRRPSAENHVRLLEQIFGTETGNLLEALGLFRVSPTCKTRRQVTLYATDGSRCDDERWISCRGENH